MSYKCHDDSKRIFLGNWREGIFVIDTFLFSETFGNKFGLKSFDIAFNVALCLKDPFTADGFTTIKKFDEILDTVMGHRFQLFIHSFHPFTRIITFHGL